VFDGLRSHIGGRLIGSVRRECLDHVIVLNEEHLQKVLDEYGGFFNDARPHQGIGQRRPATADQPALAARSGVASGAVIQRLLVAGV
jgi:uncharacterized protein YyaL (SSP411 family)